jgi:hypothetical protein
MPDARYSVQAVVGRKGDTVSGPFLGRVATLADAFTVVGEAIEKDHGPAGRNLFYVIRDELDETRAWTVIQHAG